MDFLDEMRDEVHAWTESLWDEPTGGFRMNAEVGPNVMTTTDVAWMRYATHDPDLYGPHREAWVRYLQTRQDPDTGVVAHDLGPGGQGHSNGHALWQTVRALNILGGKLLLCPIHFRALACPEALRSWFDRVDWDGPRSNHHEVLGLTPLLASLDSADWSRVFFEKIAEQQNPETGAWPRPQVNISRTFAYTALHRAVGLIPPRPEKIVDVILSLQRPNGFWQERPGFLTMDSAYVLARLPVALDYRRGDAHGALARLRPALMDFHRAQKDRIRQTPHEAQAIVHTFSLLQEAFPDELPSERPYRFDWDRPSMYYCEEVAGCLANDKGPPRK